jgi:DNA-binding transcriptional ArsR family regulator
MADLLPSSPDTSAADEADPRVVGLDDEDAGDVLAALGSETARQLLAELHEEPDTPSGVAERVDTSLQNTQYHLGRMADAGLLEVVDTAYSAKGREMKVYAPADRPLVVFAGQSDEAEGLLGRLIGAVGALGVASAVVEYLLRDGPWLPSAGGDGGASTMAVETADAAAGGAGGAAGLGLPPGALFFLGGAFVLAVVTAVVVFRRR